MGRALNKEELDDYLKQPIICRLATVQQDGHPYIVPLWQEWDGEALAIVARERSRYVQHIQHEPRVAVTVDDAEARVLIIGRAQIVEGPTAEGQWVEVAFRMAERYGGEDGLRYLRGTLDRPRYLIRIEPETITSWTGGGWHPRYYDG